MSGAGKEIPMQHVLMQDDEEIPVMARNLGVYPVNFVMSTAVGPPSETILGFDETAGIFFLVINPFEGEQMTQRMPHVWGEQRARVHNCVTETAAIIRHELHMGNIVEELKDYVQCPFRDTMFCLRGRPPTGYHRGRPVTYKCSRCGGWHRPKHWLTFNGLRNSFAPTSFRRHSL